MVTKTGNTYIYDNFGIGVVTGEDPEKDTFGLAFTEKDFGPEDERNPSHIFSISKDQIDPIIEMLTQVKGARIHMPTAEDVRNVSS